MYLKYYVEKYFVSTKSISIPLANISKLINVSKTNIASSSVHTKEFNMKRINIIICCRHIDIP